MRRPDRVRRAVRPGSCAGWVLAMVLLASSTNAAAPKPPANDYVDLSPIGVPIVSHGRLVNYVFVTLRLLTRPGASAVTLREKEPYFRDALVRLADRTPLNPPGVLIRLDDNLVTRFMAGEVASVVGPDMVKAVRVVSETPQRAVLPKP